MGITDTTLFTDLGQRIAKAAKTRLDETGVRPDDFIAGCVEAVLGDCPAHTHENGYDDPTEWLETFCDAIDLQELRAGDILVSKMGEGVYNARIARDERSLIGPYYARYMQSGLGVLNPVTQSWTAPYWEARAVSAWRPRPAVAAVVPATQPTRSIVDAEAA